MLQREINSRYEKFCQKNTMERENATSVKNTMMATLSGAAAIAGAVGSYLVAGQSGLRIFFTTIASAAGGGGAGAVINRILPSSWTNSESVIGGTIRFVTSNLNEIENFLHPRNRAIANQTRPSNITSTSASGSTNNTANTDNVDPLSRVWNVAKSNILSVVNSILHFRFRRN